MLDFRDIKIRPITKDMAYDIVSKYHYSKVMPKLTTICYGGIINNFPYAVLTLGWGVRPKHTIKKLFPSLDTSDYFEIGKMCLHPDLPKNSETYFMSKVFDIVKIDYPNVKLIYTWADGILGKPGYVYQAMNFLYG